MNFKDDIRQMFPPPLKRILLLGLLMRVISIFIFTDLTSDYYWEYGEIAKSILSGKGYSLHSIQDNFVVRRYLKDVTPLPTAYMSPGYVFVLIPFIALRSTIIANILLLTLQMIVSLVTIVLVYHFAAGIFSPQVGIFSALASALLPDFAYAAVSYTPTVLYHAGVIALLILIYNGKGTVSLLYSVSLSLLCVALTYLRFEFILYVFILALLLVSDGSLKKGVIVLMVTIAMIAPWSTRNYAVFGEIVPLGTGAGLNMYRGNNPEGIGSWGNDKTNALLQKIPRDRRFEIVVDSIFRKQAWDFIQREPLRETKIILVKISQLWFFSSLRPTRFEAIYVATSLLAFIFFAVGVAGTWDWHRFKYLYLYFIYSTILAIVFLALPRHQTMMRIGMLPFIGSGIQQVWNFLKEEKSP